MSGIVEYAVRMDTCGISPVIRETVTSDIKQAEQARNARQADADYRTKKLGAEPAEFVLVMRTCTPWCEVYQPKKENKQ